MVQLYNDYKDHADFLTVYIREAHTTDGWQMKSNLDQNICYPQPTTMAQRLAIANDFTQRFHYPLPLCVDDMSNTADNAYAAWPERIYIIDTNGRIAYRGGMGPFHYNPQEARAWLAAHFGPVNHPATEHAAAKPEAKQPVSDPKAKETAEKKI